MFNKSIEFHQQINRSPTNSITTFGKFGVAFFNNFPKVKQLSGTWNAFRNRFLIFVRDEFPTLEK
jgi:hypothetical protein